MMCACCAVLCRAVPCCVVTVCSPFSFCVVWVLWRCCRWVTGHSLGAALAEIAALDLAATVVMPTSLYTFGCPRVGDDTWYKYFDTALTGEHYRVTHYADPVPHLPPEVRGSVESGGVAA